MAYYHIFPEIDTTIYSHPDRQHLNTGRDEILEVVKEVGSQDTKHYPSRILIKFANEDLTEVIENIIGSEDFNTKTTCSLELTSIEPKNLTQILNLQAYAVSQSWQEGSGRYSNTPTGSDGVSWINRNGSIYENKWVHPIGGIDFSPILDVNDTVTDGFVIGTHTSTGQTWIYDPTGAPSYMTPGTTGSISSSVLPHGGGMWYTGSGFEVTQQFLYGDDLNTNINLLEPIKKHSASLFAGKTYPDGIPNYGFIIKQPDSVEAFTKASFGEMQYFSVETKTIYPPTLTFKWDDSKHKKQKKAKQEGPLNVHLYNNQPEYNQNDVATFRIHIRDKYPKRKFSTTSNYLDVGYFTTSSYYSIRDAHTEEEVIPFDETNTKLSADSDGMFFKIYMKGLQPERYYRVLFKHKNEESTTVYDNNDYFKIVR
tara:strand:+ start:873 stop:2147 length:1275 start_codon:yes stop_codon:yes gene_type:complete